MFDIKRFGKRVMMTGLFFAALLTTAETVTGLNVKAIVTYPNLNYSPGNDIGDSQSNELTATSIVNMFTLSNKHTLATAVKPQTLAESENWSKYPSKKVIATGYTAGIESTGKKPGHPLYGITFSGVKVKRDLYSTIAADPNVFPLGTILYIPDYGFGVVADTGSKIKGNVIDLYFESVEDVYNEWGKRTVEVLIIEEGNGYVTEEDLQALNENEAMQVFRQDFLKKAEE